MYSVIVHRHDSLFHARSGFRCGRFFWGTHRNADQGRNGV
jgi:hypothetical protein